MAVFGLDMESYTDFPQKMFLSLIVQHQGNGDELAIALKSAVAHPIERYIRGHRLLSI